MHNRDKRFVQALKLSLVYQVMAFISMIEVCLENVRDNINGTPVIIWQVLPLAALGEIF